MSSSAAEVQRDAAGNRSIEHHREHQPLDANLVQQARVRLQRANDSEGPRDRGDAPLCVVGAGCPGDGHEEASNGLKDGVIEERRVLCPGIVEKSCAHCVSLSNTAHARSLHRVDLPATRKKPLPSYQPALAHVRARLGRLLRAGCQSPAMRCVRVSVVLVLWADLALVRLFGRDAVGRQGGHTVWPREMTIHPAAVMW